MDSPRRSTFPLAAATLALLPSLATARTDPVVPGFTVTTYATVSDPDGISFDPSGVLYVANADNDIAGVRVHRVAAGGAPVVEYGPVLYDPDGVLFDATGAVSGVPGSLLVARISAPSSDLGEVTVIRPDETSFTLFGISVPGTASNPTELALDGTGRLIVTDFGLQKVFTDEGGQATELFSLPTTRPLRVAVDAANRIFTTALDGVIRVHDAAGNEVDGSFATGMGRALEFGPGTGVFGADLFGIDLAGQLVRFDSAGTPTVIGSGFVDGDLAFGPDGALYASQTDDDRVLRIAPVGAACAFRNGSGVNPPDYACDTLPALGSAWKTSVATNANTAATLVALAWGGPIPGVPSPIGPGELLVSLVPFPKILTALGAHTLNVPADPSLMVSVRSSPLGRGWRGWPSPLAWGHGRTTRSDGVGGALRGPAGGAGEQRPERGRVRRRGGGIAGDAVLVAAPAAGRGIRFEARAGRRGRR